MRDCHSIVGLYTYQNRVPFAPSLRWVSCKERDRLPHEGANFHSSFVHYPEFQVPQKAMGQHTGAHVVVPTGVFAHFIVCHTQFRFRFLKALFNGPPHTT